MLNLQLSQLYNYQFSHKADKQLIAKVIAAERSISKLLFNFPSQIIYS